MQLIVLGMHRSGTSMLARSLNLLGAYFGPEGASTGSNVENPYGFWERRDVRALNDMVLHECGWDWNRVSEFDVSLIPASVEEKFLEQASKLVLGLDAHRPWMIKEPRLCLLFPLWRKVLQCPVVIHIFRNPIEVASSLEARNGIPIPAGLQLWERYVRSALGATIGLPSVITTHQELLTEPAKAIGEIYQALLDLDVRGLRMPAEREVQSFIKVDLYRHRESRRDLRPFRDSSQVKLFKGLLANDIHALDAPGGGDDQMIEYEATLPSKPPTQNASTPSTSANATALALEYSRAEVGALQECLRSSNASIVHLKESERILRESANALFSQVSDREIVTGRLRQQLDRADNEKAALRDSLDKAHAIIDQLRVEKLESRGQIEDGRRRILLQEDEISNLRDQVQEQGATICKDAEVIESSLRKIGFLDEEILALQAQLKERNTAAEAERNAANTLRKELTALRKELTDNARKLQSAEASIQERFEELAKLTNVLLQRDAALQSLMAENARARATINELEGKNASLSAIATSRTWRLTAPLRAVSRTLRHFRSRQADSSDQTARLILESGLFDHEWYLAENHDVAASGIDPLEHYLRFGASEGRRPGPRFDPSAYLRLHPDVAEAGLDPLMHYLAHGRNEGRSVG